MCSLTMLCRFPLLTCRKHSLRFRNRILNKTMSQELTLNLSFTCNNPSTGGGYSDNVRINSQYTQNAQGANAEVVSIPTSPTTISLSNLTTLGYAYFQNLDAANFITVGQQGVAISAPTQTSPSTSTSGGTLAAATYYYKITALSLGGETTPSGEQSQVTTGSTSTVTVNWNAVTGATGYNIYRSTSTGTEHL